MNYIEERKLSGRLTGGVPLSATVNPASVAANVAVAEALAVPGVLLGDFVIAFTLPLSVAVAAVHAEVTDNDEVTVTFINPTAGALDPAADTLTVYVVRPDQPGPGVG